MSSIMILLALVGKSGMEKALVTAVWAARWAYFAARFSRLRWAP